MAGSSQQNLEVAQAVYDAYESGNVPGLLALLHDDFELNVPDVLPWGGNYNGVPGFGEFMQKLVSAYKDPSIVVEEFVQAGDNIIMIGRSLGTFVKTGDRFEVRLVDVCRIRDGKLIGLDIYHDAPALLALLPR